MNELIAHWSCQKGLLKYVFSLTCAAVTTSGDFVLHSDDRMP